jgi:hypothetical protein
VEIAWRRGSACFITWTVKPCHNVIMITWLFACIWHFNVVLITWFMCVYLAH